MNIKVLLADDHEMVREGLQALLETEPDIDVVAAAGEGREAVAQACRLKPDVIVMDITMPGLNGIDATRQILAEVPSMRILCLSIHAETRFVTGMIEAGAAGYLIKNCTSKELVTAVRAVAAGQTYLSPSIAGDVLRNFLTAGQRGRPSPFNNLSERERQVLQLIAEGFSVKEIATRLDLSVNTVHTHRQNLMRKLELAGTADIVRYAIREGLVSL